MKITYTHNPTKPYQEPSFLQSLGLNTLEAGCLAFGVCLLAFAIFI